MLTFDCVTKEVPCEEAVFGRQSERNKETGHVRISVKQRNIKTLLENERQTKQFREGPKATVSLVSGKRFVLHNSGKILYFEIPSTKSVHIFNLQLESMEGMQANKLYANFSLRVVVAPYPCIIQGSTVPFSCTALGLPGIQRLGQKPEDSFFKKSNGFRAKTCAYCNLGFPLTGRSLLDGPKVLQSMYPEFPSGF